VAQHVGSVIGFAGDAIRCWFDDSGGAAAPRAVACAAAMQQVMGGLDGLAQKVAKLNPVIFVRYGRFTITNSSGFVTRRADDVVRSLGLGLLRSERVRASLALRFDAGRSEATSDVLKGQGDIKATVRARAAASWKLDGPWRLGAAWSVDAFGRGGGNFGDVSVGWEHPLGHGSTLTVSSSLGPAADSPLTQSHGN